MQLEFEIPIRTIWGRYCCPKCNRLGLPEERYYPERIIFWICRNPKCNFSSNDIGEFKWVR